MILREKNEQNTNIRSARIDSLLLLVAFFHRNYVKCIQKLRHIAWVIPTMYRQFNSCVISDYKLTNTCHHPRDWKLTPAKEQVFPTDASNNAQSVASHPIAFPSKRTNLPSRETSVRFSRTVTGKLFRVHLYI